MTAKEMRKVIRGEYADAYAMLLHVIEFPAGFGTDSETCWSCTCQTLEDLMVKLGIDVDAEKHKVQDVRMKLKEEGLID